MKRTGLLVALGALTALTAPAAAIPAAAVATVHPFVARAPESAFRPATAGDLGTACERPAPDGRVSTTIHCYGPDDLRTFYGIGPLDLNTTDGAGQTIVAVDAYGSPTAATDLAFLSLIN